MNSKRKVEVFSAGCSICEGVIDLVNRLACDSCEVTVLDMKDTSVSARAAQLGIKAVPAVVVDGVLAECCVGRGVDETALRNAGIGQAI
ncbi:MAG: thioredoxin family protein [Gammaproteobacteria bacterium]|nr:thioredoxin family protein [Gammaproteobacteria bacterium]